jgi:hypothetical protein
MIIQKPIQDDSASIDRIVEGGGIIMLQRLCSSRPATKQQPIIRVVLHADDLLQSSIIETIIDALFDHMWQANIVVCVRPTPSKHAHE